MRKTTSVLAQVTILIAVAAVAAAIIFGPEAIVDILNAKAGIITAEGHKELDFAAAEAIRANARQVDAVTGFLTLGYLLVCLGPIGIIALFFSYLILRRKDNSEDELL